MPLKHPQNFWRKVDMSGPDGCWQWRGLIMPDGYGQVQMVGANARVAHRVAYEEVKGPIPAGLVLDHLCRNRSCVNPEHLEPVTHRENVLRGVNYIAQNANKTRCHKGHPFSPENTYVKPGGNRICKTCRRQREQGLRWAARLAAPKPPCYNTLKTHCKHGHEYTPENTYHYHTHRCCRACARDKAKRYSARKRATA